jgi:hypothetical protein
MYKKYLLKFLLLFFIAANVYGQGFRREMTEATSWTTINVTRHNDRQNSEWLTGFDINTSLFLINVGIDYKNITYTDANKLTFYAGLGLAYWIQFQAGFSKNSFSTRIRASAMLKDIAGDDFCPVLDQITITPMYERYYNNPNMKRFWGIGLGISINNLYGFVK